MKPASPSIILPRRNFIRQLGCTGMTTWALSSTIRDLRLINSAMGQSSLSGYKAMVCLFLNGGNDANNWLVPTDPTTFNDYTSIRGNLALPPESLLPLRTGPNISDPLYADSPDGHTYGFHPNCAELQTLFGEKKIAAILNVGTLVRPTTRSQYLSSNSAFYKPPQLFSHSDQVTQWQTSIPDQPPTKGWGGRIADLLNATANPSGRVSMAVSLNGANTFEVGDLVSQYHVSSSGAETLSGNLMAGNQARIKALKDVIALSDPAYAVGVPSQLQKRAIAEVAERAIATGDLLNSSIQSTAMATDTPPGTWVWTTPFPNTGLGNQLKMIARLIAARGPGVNTLEMNRQIFFCSVGGYDTHTAQVTLTPTPNTTTGTHANLLNEVSECMFAFQRAMEQLGVANQVTTFTASDFSRTLPTNSQGSDHGWGSHHMIMGGAVKGGKTYGKLPTLAINGPDDTGTGRWIPTLAVDQYSATLAKWFGVDTGNLAAIFPNLSRFSSSDLGFMDLTL
jgi:uncharacterized protein (DUF1501 family)